jgi:hypothetical protein
MHSLRLGVRVSGFGSGVSGFPGFGFQSSGFRFWFSGFTARFSCFKFQDFRTGVQVCTDVRCQVSGFTSLVSVSGCRGWGSGVHRRRVSRMQSLRYES